MRRAAWIAPAVAAVLVAAGAVTYAVADGDGGGSSAVRVPGAESADAGFARDMAVHHQQAVEMSFLVRDRSKSDDVRLLAYDIANTQANQRGMMLGWLDLWGYSPTTTGAPMAWMGMGPPSAADQSAGVLMPGMASRADLAKLRTASPREADILYLRLMIKHHEGGIHMVEGLLNDTKSPKQANVRHLAETMLTGQQGEITLMKDMLKKRGVTP